MTRDDRLPDYETLTTLLGPGSARAIAALMEAGAPDVRPGHPWAVAFGGRAHTIRDLAAIAGCSVASMYRALATASRMGVLRLLPGPTRQTKVLEIAVPRPSDPAGPLTPSCRHPGCCSRCAAELQVLYDRLAALTARLEQTLAASVALLATVRPASTMASPVAAEPQPVTSGAPSVPLACETRVRQSLPPPSTHLPVPTPTPAPAQPVSPGQATPSNEATGHCATVSRTFSLRTQGSTVRLPESVAHVFRAIVHRSPTPTEAARIARHLERYYAAGADMGDLIHAMYVAQAKYTPTPDRPRIECEAFFEKFFHRELRDFLRRRYGHERHAPRARAAGRRPVPPPSNVFLRRPDRKIDYEAFYLRPPAA